MSSTSSSSSSSSLPSSMQALQIQSQGDLSVLEMRDLPLPAPSPTEVLIKVDYAGVNLIDTYQRAGLYKLPMPFVLGNEAAGTVVAAGSGAHARVGDKVAAYTGGGSFAQYVKAPLHNTAVLPDGVSTRDGAAALLQGLTAWTLVKEAYEVKRGDWALVHAAAGGVGLLLCQICAHLGAHVIGTTSTPEKAAIARANGAEHVVLYGSSQPSIVDPILRLTGGRGCAVIYDGVGAATWEDDFQVVARKGTLCSFGNASGAVQPFAPLKLAGKNVKLVRPTLVNYVTTKEEFEEHCSALFGLMRDGVVKLSVHGEYELSAEGVRRAQEDITGRKTSGKLLVKVGGSE